MQRTILIGLDGATWTVLDPLMADGTMPRLRALVGGGARGILRSTAHPLTPPAWTTMVTGRSPGHHGIFDFVRAAEGEGGLYFTLNAFHDIRSETVWSMVSRQGGRATTLNFPVHQPPPEIDGYVIPGFVPWRHLRRSVHPREWYDRLREREGFDARVLCMDMNEELKSIQYLPPEEYREWIGQHIERERQWFAVVRDLLRDDPTDLFAALFDGVDKLQHLCWPHLDPALQPAEPDEHHTQVRGWCLDYFRELDAFIGEMVELAGPDARVYIASDHGFGPTHDVFYANVWLEQNGFLVWNDDMPKDEAGMVSGDKIKSHVVGIDWERTQAYALTPSSNGIFIRPGSDRDAVRRKLVDGLKALRHPRTGEPFVRDVLLREDTFEGPASAGAPDLTLVLHDHGFLSVLNADRAIWERPIPAGTHHPDGVFVAAGAGVRAGVGLEPLEIVDVAPALLHSLGLTVPSDLEGRVPTAAYEPSFLESQPVRPGPATVPPVDPNADEDEGMSAEDEAKIMERLQALGYIE